MRVVLIGVLAVSLAGCKPPKFDQVITCPNFYAAEVAVYIYGDSLFVLHPDRTHAMVDRTECVVTRE